MWNKLLLFISSYVPLYLLLIFKNIFERITEEGKFVNILLRFRTAIWFNEINDWAICILLFVTIVSVIYLWWLLGKEVGQKKYIIRKVSDETGNYYFNYISVYLLSCMGLTLNSIVDCFVFLSVMIIVGFIYISNNMMYLNPVINIMGYKVYNCILDSVNTNDKEIESIVVAPDDVKVQQESFIIASNKQNFIYIKKNKG